MIESIHHKAWRIVLSPQQCRRWSLIVVCIVLAITSFGQHLQIITKGEQRKVISEMVNIGYSNDNNETYNDNEEDTYTLVVVRCTGNMTWLEQVPKDWKIVVYEKCLHKTQPISLKYSIPIKNKGKEECNGYLDYLYDYYYNLTSVTIFVHDDVLYPWSKWKGTQAHTPFATFIELVNATITYLPKNQGFIHYGVSRISQRWGVDKYHGTAEKILWPYLQTDTIQNPPEWITFKPSAHMAVRRRMIHKRSRELYYTLLQQVRYGTSHILHPVKSRQFCCALERSWHILFGEIPTLPDTANVAQQLRTAGLLDNMFGEET